MDFLHNEVKLLEFFSQPSLDHHHVLSGAFLQQGLFIFFPLGNITTDGSINFSLSFSNEGLSVVHKSINELKVDFVIGDIFSLLFSGSFDKFDVLVLDAVVSFINEFIVSVDIDELGAWQVVWLDFACDLLELVFVELEFHCGLEGF
jgi:hypothetical protein